MFKKYLNRLIEERDSKLGIMSQPLNPDFLGYFSQAPPGRIAMFSIGAFCYAISMSLSCFHIYRHFKRGREETKVCLII